MSQHVEIVSEPPPIYFLAQCLDKGPSTQHLRPNIEPIYHLIQLVNDLKVRRNQPQGSNLAFKVRSRQSLCGSSRSRSGICQGTNGNLYGIFSLEKSSVVMK